VIVYSALWLATGKRDGPEPAVPKDTPPTFLVVADNDGFAEGTVRTYLALRKAGVKAELHVYANGGHGFGLRAKTPPPVSDWTDRLEAWLRFQKLLQRKATKEPAEASRK
jgi:acetyl esterase/lipase